MADDVQKVLRRVRKAGWSVRRTKKNHYKVTPPSGEGSLFFSATPGDRRAIRELYSKLRRAGFDLGG